MSEPTTPTAPRVHVAINQVKQAIGKEGITKDRKNAEQNYRFRGIDDVYNALNPILAAAGLNVLPRMLKRECTERKTRSGAPLFSVVVEAEFDFVSAEDGSTYTARTFGEAMDTADKATNKAMSAAFKYVCMQAFAIPTEGDNDADATTHELAADKQPPAARQPQQRTAAPRQQAPKQLTDHQRLAELMVREDTAPVVQELLTAWNVAKIDDLPAADAKTGLKWVLDELKKAGVASA